MREKRKPGRPQGTTIKPSNLYVQLPVRIPQYLLDRVDRVSQKMKQSRTETVMSAISDYLWKNENLWKKNP